MGHRAELTGALVAARDLPDGPGKVAELERVAAHADATGDLRLGVDARLELLDAYQYEGERWRLREPLHHCLAAVDRAPELFDRRDAERLRWHQRGAVVALLGTPRVGLEQASSTLADLARRDEAAGRSRQVTEELHCRIADHLGDEPAARSGLQRWRAAGADPTDDCVGCNPVRQAELLAGWGEWSTALAVLQPALTGVVSCTDQPERALTAALLPELHLGRAESAARGHLRAWRRHRRERTAFPRLATHLRFCALGGYPERGLALLAEQLPRLDRPTDDLAAMEFAAAGALVCTLAVEAGLGDRRIHRPAYLGRPAATLAVESLGAELLAVATDLAGRFDARNGTGHQSGRIASWLAARPVAEPVPLPAGAADDDEADEESTDDGTVEPVGERAELLGPLSVAAITRALNRRGDRYGVEPDGRVVGRWGNAVIHFERVGEAGAILHARVVALRRLPAGRLADAYEFCNAWNSDRLLPKAYVHDAGTGELILAGNVTTDLAHGVAPAQLGVLVNATVATGVAFAAAVAALP